MTDITDDMLPELPEELGAVRCMIRGEMDYSEAGDYYYTRQQMRDYARAALSATGKQQVGEVLTDTYVQTVPGNCDRIVWRGNYYHLPINQAGEVQAKEVQPVAHSDSQWIK